MFKYFIKHKIYLSKYNVIFMLHLILYVHNKHPKRCWSELRLWYSDGSPASVGPFYTNLRPAWNMRFRLEPDSSHVMTRPCKDACPVASIQWSHMYYARDLQPSQIYLQMPKLYYLSSITTQHIHILYYKWLLT